MGRDRSPARVWCGQAVRARPGALTLALLSSRSGSPEVRAVKVETVFPFSFMVSLRSWVSKELRLPYLGGDPPLGDRLAHGLFVAAAPPGVLAQADQLDRHAFRPPGSDL